MRIIFSGILLPFITVLALGQAANKTDLKQKQFVENLQKHLDSLSRFNDFSGAVLIAKDNKIIFENAYGFSNRSDAVRNRIDTKFNVASMGKMFTSVCILQLVEKGKINLNDKVGKYLPNFPNKSIADSVTIYQLLTHRSGMGSFWEDYFKSPHDKFKELVDYIPLFQNQPLLFTPGQRFEYSNAGYIVLGLVLEAVTGENYFDYVKKTIYTPIRMNNTDAYELDKAIPNLAIGYEISRDEPHVWNNNVYQNVLKGCSAGGGFSTVEDMLKFATALQQYKLLNKENTDLATTAKDSGSYGFGFEAITINGHKIFGHTGGFPGIKDELKIYKDVGYAVILLTNGDNINWWDVDLFIQEHLAGAIKVNEDFNFTVNVLKETALKGYEAGLLAKNHNPRGCTFMEYVAEMSGNNLLHHGDYKHAIAVFKLDTTFYPNSPFAYNVLGHAYKVAGDKAAAIQCYKIHIQNNPGDTDAIERLKQYIKK